jgi:hypothetical protein
MKINEQMVTGWLGDNYYEEDLIEYLISLLNEKLSLKQPVEKISSCSTINE